MSNKYTFALRFVFVLFFWWEYNTIQYCGTWGTWQVPIGWVFYLHVNVGLCLFFEEKFGLGVALSSTQSVKGPIMNSKTAYTKSKLYGKHFFFVCVCIKEQEEGENVPTKL